ncbi:MAG: hypothetical protein LBO68_05315 [Synergistaceae bacterium]|jgi:hypothetical protein|nr:hypothetical protein [Synergistaceae bacterium]
MLGKGFPNAGIVYRDVTVISIRREENGNLRLWGIYGGRDYLDVLYEDVLYSQIDETNAGLRVALVEELTLDELSELRHNMGRNRMLREAPERFTEFLHAVSLEEYRIYTHYTLKEGPRGTEKGTEERLILARRVRVEGPEERLARHERENRQYRFYAFVSHANGGKDEKWARWIQRRLKNFRIPVDAVSKLRREENAGPALSEHIPSKFSVARGEIPTDSLHHEPLHREPLHPKDLHYEAGSPLGLARYLIIVCSPRGAQSERVERNTRDFTESGKEDYIIPFIIGGEPAGSGESRCYPPSLPADILGVTLADGSREEALIRIMARLLRVKFSRLYQRHLRERRRFMVRALMAASVLLFVLSGLTGWAISREIEAVRRREEADGLARFLTEDMRSETRLPEKVRAMIDEKLRAYREKHPKHSNLSSGRQGS